MAETTTGTASVVPEQFLHMPPRPDFSRWPFDVPWVMANVREFGLEVNTLGTLNAMQFALDDMTERCRTAECRGYEAAVAHAKAVVS